MQPLSNLNINDIANEGIYAKPKTSAETQSANRNNSVAKSRKDTQGFANPYKNVALFGLSPGMTVADFGAGSGHYVMAMASALGESGKVYAVDVQKDILTKIKNDASEKGFSNIEVVWGDLEQNEGSKIVDASLDLVLVSNILFQSENKRNILAEAHRTLKPNAVLIIIDWQDSYGGLGPIQTAIFDKTDAINLAMESNFKLKSEFDAGAHHYGLIFNKQ